MRNNLVPSVLKSLEKNEYVRYGYESFTGKLTLPKNGPLNTQVKSYHAGTFGIKKRIFFISVCFLTITNKKIKSYICV